MSTHLRTFLIASVLLNLLLIGMLAGGLLHRITHTARTPQQIAATLPPEKRDQFLEHAAQAVADTAPLREQLTAARLKGLCILSTQPFDKNAYLTQVDKVHALRGQLNHHMATTVASLAPQFTPEQRIAFADLMRMPPVPMPADPCNPTK